MLVTLRHKLILVRIVFWEQSIESVFISLVLNLIISIMVPVSLSVACKCPGVHDLFFKPVSYFRRKYEQSS